MWRFRRELHQAGHPGYGERAATRAVAAAMLAAAAYVLAQAARALITRAHPRQSGPGIALLAGSAVVLPVLGRIKLRLARQLQTRALRGTAFSARPVPAWPPAALAGLAADRALGWWQADPVAASLIALFLFREGWRTLTHPGP